MTEDVKKYLESLAFLALFVVWIALLFIISPEEVVDAIGVNGGYALIFFTALIAASALTSASFYTLLVSLASTGEFNPIILGLVSAPALVAGDYIFFYLGLKSRSVLSKRFVEPFSGWIERRPKWTMPIVAYFYSLAAPLPQDLLMLAFGMGGVQFRRIVIPALLGVATFVILTSYFLSVGAAPAF